LFASSASLVRNEVYHGPGGAVEITTAEPVGT